MNPIAAVRATVNQINMPPRRGVPLSCCEASAATIGAGRPSGATSRGFGFQSLYLYKKCVKTGVAAIAKPKATNINKSRRTSGKDKNIKLFLRFCKFGQKQGYVPLAVFAAQDHNHQFITK